MNSNELAFHNLNKLLEDTENILFTQLHLAQTIDELTIITDQYFKLYEYKSDIVKGITSTLEYRELLDDKYKWLKSLSKQCDKIYNTIDIPKVMDSRESYLFFAKSSIAHNRIKPLLDYVIHEIKLCLNIRKEKNDFPNEDLLDLSDSNAVQKIIYLHELGVIDFLRNIQPFNTTTNSLATILSAITKENASTIQPYLSALFTRDETDNKHPYYTHSTVTKVKKHLTSIGFKGK